MHTPFVLCTAQHFTTYLFCQYPHQSHTLSNMMLHCTCGQQVRKKGTGACTALHSTLHNTFPACLPDVKQLLWPSRFITLRVLLQVRKKGTGAAKEEAAGGKTWRDENVTKRIEHALVKGIDTYIVKARATCACPAGAADSLRPSWRHPPCKCHAMHALRNVTTQSSAAQQVGVHHRSKHSLVICRTQRRRATCRR